MHQWHRGQALTIWLCAGCQDSWDEAEALVPGTRAACKGQFRARLEHLANVGRLRSPDHMNSEGDGIFAVKATCGLRGYGWFCSVDGRRAFVISHVVLKRQQKADPADLKKAAETKALIEKQVGDHKKNGNKRA